MLLLSLDSGITLFVSTVRIQLYIPVAVVWPMLTTSLADAITLPYVAPSVTDSVNRVTVSWVSWLTSEIFQSN